MKSKLPQEAQDAYIKFRLEKANEAIEEARMLANGGHYSTAISRLYYACFYATVALLLTVDEVPKSHAGAKGLLGKYFVNTGLLDKRIAHNYSVLFDKRHKNDYENFISATAEEVESFTPQAQEFVDVVAKLLNK